MAAFLGPYRVYSTGETATTDDGTTAWPTSQTTIHVEFVDTTAIQAGIDRAAEAIRRFDDREADLAKLEAEESRDPPPWLGVRSPRLPARAFTRRPSSTRRRRRTETAKRQKAARPP